MAIYNKEGEEEEKKQTDADKLITIGIINYRFTDQHGVVHALSLIHI